MFLYVCFPCLTQVYRKGTSCKASHHKSDFVRSSSHCMAKSYSIVLGWAQCEVETAFLYTTNHEERLRNNKQSKLDIEDWNAKKIKEKQTMIRKKEKEQTVLKGILVTISSRCIWNLNLSRTRWPAKLVDLLDTLRFLLRQITGLQMQSQ